MCCCQSKNLHEHKEYALLDQLDDYLTIDQFNQIIAGYYTQAEVDQLLDNYYTKAEVDNLVGQHLSFRAEKTSVSTGVTGDGTLYQVPCLNLLNQSSTFGGGHFNTTNGRFTAPVDGFYDFFCNTYAYGLNPLNHTTIYHGFRINTVDVFALLQITHAGDTNKGVSHSLHVKLFEDDTIIPFVQVLGSSKTVNVYGATSGQFTQWGGHLVHTT